MARHRLVGLCLTSIGLLLALGSVTHAAPATPPEPWPMFHHDERHTGLADGAGNIVPSTGPFVRWKFRVFDELTNEDDSTYVRWTSSFPLGDLDGDGKLEVIVTTPDVAAPLVLTTDGVTLTNRILALKDAPGQSPPVQVMWSYTSTLDPGTAGLDTYSPALADADGDGLLDVIFTARDGYVRALKGATGQVLWEFQTDRRMEAGPMIADLYGDGSPQAIIVTDCQSGIACPTPGEQAHLFVLPITSTGTVTTPLWSLDYPYKLDSAEPAVADLDPNDGQNRKAILIGTWGGELLVAWRSPGGPVITNTLSLRTLDPTIPISYTPVIRSSPIIWDFGEGETTVFGWLPTDENASDARVSAIGLNANMISGTVQFTNRWTIPDYDVWKSSPALIPRTGLLPLVVMGYGLGIQQPGQSGPVGQCDPLYVTGGIVAVTPTGAMEWGHNFGNSGGNIRASPAVGDVDGDGQPEVILPMGCYGKLHAYNGVTGAAEWTLQLGPRTQSSPSIGDVNGDGKLEIVVGSYDGNVWVLEGGYRLFLPAITR